MKNQWVDIERVARDALHGDKFVVGQAALSLNSAWKQGWNDILSTPDGELKSFCGLTAPVLCYGMSHDVWPYEVIVSETQAILTAFTRTLPDQFSRRNVHVQQVRVGSRGIDRGKLKGLYPVTASMDRGNHFNLQHPALREIGIFSKVKQARLRPFLLLGALKASSSEEAKSKVHALNLHGLYEPTDHVEENFTDIHKLPKKLTLGRLGMIDMVEMLNPDVRQ